MKKTIALKENHEFRRLYHRGTSSAGRHLVLYCRKNRLGHNRLGLTVSAKLACAVKRNRIKRLLREAFRTVLPEIGGNWFFVVIPKVSEEYTYAGYVKDLRYALKKSGLLK